MHGFLQEIRLALRGIRQRPLLTAVAVLSIAIGVGANTAIFSVFNTLVLRPPPGVADPGRVVEVGRTQRAQGFDTFSYPELLDLQSQVPQLERVAGWRLETVSFHAGGAADRLMAMAVSHSYFDVLGTEALRGRFFSAAEDQVRGPGAVAVLSYRFWRERLGGDPAAIGRTISLDRQPFTVIGIARPEFRGHMPVVPPDVYVPLTAFGVMRPGFNAWTERRASWLTVVARLAPGGSITAANAALGTLFRRLASVDPEQYGGENPRSARVLPLKQLPGGGRSTVAGFLSLLLGFAGLVLLATCANVAGMLLARAASREREIAVRLALGSGRARLIRQLLIETLVLFGLGGAAGVLLGYWSTRLLESVRLPVPVALAVDFPLDLPVLAFGLGAALLTGLLFGLVPALHASRTQIMETIRSGGALHGRQASRARRVLVSAEVGLSLVLLAAAGLFLRSLQRAADVDPGFRGEGVSIVSLDATKDGYDEAAGKQLLRELVRSLESTPGVQGAAAATDLPLDMGVSEMGVYPEGWKGHERFGMSSTFARVTPRYFTTIGTRLLRGRDFSDRDVPGSPLVAVVSRTFAERAWPGQDPLGRQLRLGSDGEPVAVVGVAADAKSRLLMEPDEPMLYLPLAQNYASAVTLLVRTRFAPAAAAARIRRAVLEVDPRLALSPVQLLTDYTAIGLLPQRIGALLASALGLLALLLSAMGVYGVIAFVVAQRTREIGVRMALGASSRSVGGMVLRGGLGLALPGVALGALAALALGRVMQGFILGVPPADPLTFLLAPLLLLVVVVAACWLPAVRAARVQPLDALRAE